MHTYRQTHSKTSSELLIRQRRRVKRGAAWEGTRNCKEWAVCCCRYKRIGIVKHGERRKKKIEEKGKKVREVLKLQVLVELFWTKYP